jgi:hypothetical protein
VFESRVLRRIFGPKREQVAGSWKRLHNEELRNLYDSPYIIRVIKPRKMKVTGHVARMGEMINSYIFFIRKSEGKRPSEDLGIDGKVILE